ncbi:YhgE/Pip domain-containing protein [Oceanobacillus polygoni]|uniref:Membrane protein n=1 Tax=Oceanobacillus polygoni TaxID=1235259 RepID=A0A9X0YTZ9_9BACI|nr:YhgE/Pip domain-containing protein [Oceanobacillus polygoni]MBP2078036.1 putative membrane protein [Oceanobacillus polygoni]
MKNSWKIFSTDMKKTGTNWIALVIIGGLVLLPSLYAWFNIIASWDPYGQLDRMPVGIVNEDQGATVHDEDILVGDELINTLKEDDSMDWHFTDRQTAMERVEYGDYFAVIIIPEDFSEKLATVISDQPEKANVEYYVNEKINAISPKMTDKGASVIVENVSSQFISTVNGVIFDLFNTIGIELENELPDMERFKNYIFEMEERLPEIHDVLTGSLADANHATDIIHNAQELIPDAKRITENGLQTIDDTVAFLNEAENRLNELAPEIQKNLEHAQEVTANINTFIQDIHTADVDFTNSEQLSEQIDAQAAEAIQQIESIEAILQQLEEQSSPEDENSPNQEEIDAALEQLAALKTELENIQRGSSDLLTFMYESNEEMTHLLDGLKERAATTNESVDTFVKEYKETIEPTVLESVNNAQTTLNEARGILLEIQETIPEIENMLARTNTNLGEGKELLESILSEYPYVNSKITELADRIRQIQGETDIEEIIKLLQNDPEAEKSFFSEPIVLDANKIFPIANYGTGMTPFYTVLAIWVGGLLLISLLSTEVHKPEGFTIREQYFGKLFTFMTIGILQTLIITSGDLLLLQVGAAHPIWLIVFGLFISLVFMVIIYTLVSVFGDIGKATVIVLLVLQIAGSGGTYPVVLLPDFFQMINPFLPFTYAIDLMREAVGGIVWSRALRDMTFLLLFGLAAFILGVFLKQPINKHTRKLIKKSRESGMFH